MVSNKFKRDFYQYGALKRPGRIDRDLFQYMADCGDGYGGVQWMMYKAFGTLLFPRFVIEGCAYNGVDTLSHGYIMYNGDPIRVTEQAVVVANGEWLYINENGVALTTGVEATAQAHIVIYERDGVGVGYDVRFRTEDNILMGLRITIQDLIVNQDVDIDGNMDVDGVTNLDNTDIDGTLDVAGVTDLHDVLDMNNNQINRVANPALVGDAVNLGTLRGFMPVGTILMFDGGGWVDNVSMVGWYQCNLANVAHGVPDLEDQFIRASAASGVGGGANSVMLALNQIPTHTSGNNVGNHTHTVTTGNQSASHTHSGTTGIQLVNHTHTLPQGTGLGGVRTIVTATYVNMGSATGVNTANHQHTVTTGNQSLSHTHSGTTAIQAGTHTHTFTSPGGQVVVPTMPVYYKLIFVMRTV